MDLLARGNAVRDSEFGELGLEVSNIMRTVWFYRARPAGEVPSTAGSSAFCASRARALLLAREAIAIVGYGAGKKDVSGSNVVSRNEIRRVGRVKHDSPAIVLWHTAHNNVTDNYVRDTPSKAVLLGGMRTANMDPAPFNGTITLHEGSWLATRWDELPQARLISHIVGLGVVVVVFVVVAAAAVSVVVVSVVAFVGDCRRRLRCRVTRCNAMCAMQCAADDRAHG